MTRQKTTGTAAKVVSGSSPRSSADVEKQINETSDPMAAQAGQYVAMMNARNKFISLTFGMGWRMAITFLVPVIIGVWIDDKFNTAPSYTITAVFIGVFASAVIVWNTIKQVTAGQAEDAAKDKEHDD